MLYLFIPNLVSGLGYMLPPFIFPHREGQALKNCSVSNFSEEPACRGGSFPLKVKPTLLRRGLGRGLFMFQQGEIE
jgi:hypothetical protein